MSSCEQAPFVERAARSEQCKRILATVAMAALTLGTLAARLGEASRGAQAAKALVAAGDGQPLSRPAGQADR